MSLTANARRIQAKASRNLTSQIIGRYLRARHAPQEDLLSPVHHGNGPVSTCGGLDLVEVHAKPVDLGDPLGTPGKPKKAVLVERPQITGVQFPVHASPSTRSS